MDYSSLTLVQLKTMCRERGLRISGNKDEVIIRLMEDDEARNPVVAQQQVVYQQAPMYQQAPINQPVQYVQMPRNNSAVYNTLGILIIIYGFFRIGVVFFLGFFWDEFMDVYILESILGFIIGMAYVVGGFMTYSGYRNGVYLVLGTLTFSGLWSFVFSNEWSPLSVGFGGFTAPAYTFFCSAFCMSLAALPLFLASNELKDGWPGSLIPNQSGMAEANTATPAPVATKTATKAQSTAEKVVVTCPYCDKNLKVPADFSGNARCPGCKERFTI